MLKSLNLPWKYRCVRMNRERGPLAFQSSMAQAQQFHNNNKKKNSKNQNEIGRFFNKFQNILITKISKYQISNLKISKKNISIHNLAYSLSIRKIKISSWNLNVLIIHTALRLLNARHTFKLKQHTAATITATLVRFIHAFRNRSLL